MYIFECVFVSLLCAVYEVRVCGLALDIFLGRQFEWLLGKNDLMKIEREDERFVEVELVFGDEKMCCRLWRRLVLCGVVDVCYGKHEV